MVKSGRPDVCLPLGYSALGYDLVSGVRLQAGLGA